MAVIEMGMSHAGEIAALAHIADPDWGVVTNVGSAHVQNFAGGIAEIARAKYELVAALSAHGVAFLNCDDAYVSQFGRDFRGKTIYFGRRTVCRSARAGDCLAGRARDRTWRCWPGRTTEGCICNLLGEHNVANALAAIGVGVEAGIPLETCCRALAELRPEDKRGQILETIGGATVINDCYNCNPEALKVDDRHAGGECRSEQGRRIWWRARCWNWVRESESCMRRADGTRRRRESI